MTGMREPSPLEALADALADLARWVDGELAGGVPPKYVARCAADSLRSLAAELRRINAGE